jgi:hypothetical protein
MFFNNIASNYKKQSINFAFYKEKSLFIYVSFHK